MLIKEGRLREALTCRAHIFALNCLSLFEFEKTSTMEPEDITSVAEKIKVTREVPVSVDFQARAFTAFSILACASAKDQRIFVRVWTSLASACGSVLHHALNIWKDTIALKNQQDFVRHPRAVIPHVEWNGRHYLLPLANIWANYVSTQPPQLPDVKLGTISGY